MTMKTEVTCILAVLLASVMSAQENTLPFMDPHLPTAQRVEDLLGRLTLDEKIGQMMHASPAIERFGIPEYSWWNECLHGVARAGLATVFPQAIGLGATWDEDLMFRVATAISEEARGKHHEFARHGKRSIYQGLTFWSPNINIFRDPRWGRGQETYGEDPYLTGRMAVQFIKGLQGDDPRYFRVISTVKHFAVHSGPEPERHSFNAVIAERDFRETYLPQFKMGIQEGGAYSVMCAYNRFEGEACCGSSRLLTSILRDEWGFTGYVVSDCGAIGDMVEGHRVVPGAPEASALAVRSGCDLDCGDEYKALKQAVASHLIAEEEINTAARRLLTARFRLGMFDPPGQVAYARIPYSVVDNQQHHQLAVEAARKSIVLLRNEGNLLPLKKYPKTIAVIGPNADEWLMLLGNYNGTPSDPITPLRGIREKVGTGTKVLFQQGCSLAAGMPVFSVVPPEMFVNADGTRGLRAEFFNNAERTGKPLYVETTPNVDANWHDKAPRKDMDDDNFGVRWTGTLRPELSGTHQIGIIATCNTRLYLDDSLIARTVYHFRDEYGDPRLRKSVPLYLTAGSSHAIRVEAAETHGDAQVQLVWSVPDAPERAIDIARQADVVVMCMGLTARLEGEEMDIHIDGFRGGDRTRLDLPDIQQDLIRRVVATGKPVVLVLLSGSAIAIPWAANNVPAIVEAWYPGQAAGTAIADVLFGDYNPAGRLPVTVYRSVDDLPSFEEYAMSSRTYRYFTGTPLYPFGFGLSYSTFAYADLNVAARMHAGDSLDVSVRVRNTGDREGEEVVQVYLARENAPVPVPRRALNAFRRVRLLPGEEQTVRFHLSPDAFSLIDAGNNRSIPPGIFRVSVGGGQPDTPGTLSGRCVLE